MIDRDDDGYEPVEVPVRVRVDALIAAIAAFAAERPITVEMHPYRNLYSGEVQGVVLSDLFADRPGGGAGSEVIAEIKRLADAADLSVYTDAQGPRSREFYIRRGFERSQGRGHQLAYHPPLPAYLMARDEDATPPFGMR